MEGQRAYKFVQVGVLASSLVSTVQWYLDLGFLYSGHSLYLDLMAYLFQALSKVLVTCLFCLAYHGVLPQYTEKT